MQKIIFVFLVLAGVALAADKTITDKVRKQQIIHITINYIIRTTYRIIIHMINSRHFICWSSVQSASIYYVDIFPPFDQFEISSVFSLLAFHLFRLYYLLFITFQIKTHTHTQAASFAT